MSEPAAAEGVARASAGDASGAADARGFALERFERFLVVRFAKPHDVASWAIVGGGVRAADAVAWTQVEDRELRPPVDAVRFVREKLAPLGLSRAVGLLTSRTLDAYVTASSVAGEARADCVATVGMGNALRAGDPPGVAARIGTINVMCRVDRALTREALLEAMAIVTEAKAVAVVESGIASRQSGRPATGTGTDCIVIAAPCEGGPRARYAGKHTEVGAAVGACVEEAVRRGAQAWLRERGLA